MSDFYEEDEPVADVHARFDAATEHGRTRNPEDLTDEQIQALADEAERGYDPDRLTPRPRRPATTPVDAVPDTEWKVFTYDAAGRYIAELDAPDGHLCVDLTKLNAGSPERRVRWMVARETGKPQPRP